MCLTLHSVPEQANKPYNRSHIRWKWAVRDRNRHLAAPFQDTRIKRTGLNTAELIYNGDSFIPKGTPLPDTLAGFHVCPSREDAMALLNSSIRLQDERIVGRLVLLKIRVKGHLKSGTFRGIPSETWKHYTVLETTPASKL